MPVSFLPARRRGDDAVLDGGALRVADAVKRRDDVFCEPRSLGQHGVDDVFRETSPFYVEQVRRYVVGRYGNDRLLREGLRVEEVPVRMLERTGGSSFLTPVRSAFFIFKGLVVILVGQFKPRQAEAER